jgi:2-oxoglutarate dehydrogenase E2 component (dihydrolipoamide succinyltransferase)
VSVEIKVPQLPESVSDATLVTWHRRAGDAVKRDENLVDLETDKVVLEVPAPNDGILKEIRISDGATVTSGQVLAVLEPGDAPAASPQADAPPVQPADAGQDSGSASGASAGGPSAPAAAAPSAVPQGRETAARADSEGHQKMGPAVRKLIEEHDLDPAVLAGSGRDGRVSKADVLDYLATQRDTGIDLEGETAPEPTTAGRAAPQLTGSRNEQRVPMTRLRARIAERLVQAQQTAAMLTTFNEVDMSEVMALRKRYQEQFQKRYDIKLGFMSFFIRAAIEALREYPLLNASVDGTDIVYHEFFDIGVAVSTDRGLLVPVLRDAHNMSFAAIEKTIAGFGERARAGSIGLEDLTGGTFTITNGGIFGSMMSTPILNPPQSGILGMHAIQQRPMVVDGKIEARPMMYLALSYDHRIVDGRDAVQFLVHIKQQLEDPARLILQV